MKTLVINLKSYPQAFARTIDIAKTCAELSRNGVSVVLAPPTTLLRESSQIAKTIAQHVDPIENGSHTGKISVLEIKSAGAQGSLLNHSEHPMNHEAVIDAIALLKKNGLCSLVCVGDISAANHIGRQRPDCLVFEPPNLIGGDIAVSIAMKKEVTEFVKIARRFGSLPFIGAGIKTDESVLQTMELDADGLLVSSVVALATDPQAEVRRIAGLILRRGK